MILWPLISEYNLDAYVSVVLNKTKMLNKIGAGLKNTDIWALLWPYIIIFFSLWI